MPPTQKERVLAQIHHEETDIVPYTLGFEPGVPERLDEYYGSAAWRSRLDDAIRYISATSAEMYVDESLRPLSTDIYGTTWRTDRRPTHLETPALPEPTLKGYSFPPITTIFQPGWKEKALEAIRPVQDHFVVSGYSFGLFERTWTLRGFDNALIDAAGDPDFYEELCEQIAQHQLAIVEHLVQLPVDGIMFSDDWGYQDGVLLGAKRWRRFIKPRLARLYACAHSSGKYVLNHCCGSIVDILPDLIEIGLNVYESVQPEAKNNNPYELKRRFGDRLTFWGGLGSQSIIPFGRPEEIKAEVSRLRGEMSRGGGYILGPAKSIQPETPIENAVALVEAFLDGAG
jgi:uroporphyrinogen decarboxylase